jgi:hypothetical protein
MRVQFLTEAVPPEERLAYWRMNFARHAHHLTLDPPSSGALRGTAEGSAVGGFALIAVDTNIERSRRTASDAALDAGDRVFVRRYRGAAEWRTGRDGETFDLSFTEGDFCVNAGSWLFEETAAGGVAFLLLVIPHSALSPFVAGGRIPRPFKLPAGAPLAALLGAALDAASAQATMLSDMLVEAVLRHLCGRRCHGN